MARSASASRGGQMPLHMRVPKLKGFTNPFRVEYQPVNLDTIEKARTRRGHARHAPGERGWSVRAPS